MNRFAILKRMANRSLVVHGLGFEDASCTLFGRVTAVDGSGTTVSGEGNCLLQLDVSTITYTVVNIPEGTIVIASTAITPISSVIYNSLQTGGAWDVDTTGYNFRFTLPATAMPVGNKKSLAEVRFTTTGGSVAPGQWEIDCRRSYID
jgi:hypothetical protein